MDAMNFAEESSLESTGAGHRWLGQHRIAIIMVFIVALTAFGTGIRWGLPHAVGPETVQPWALDIIAPIAPLNEAYHGFTRAGNEFVAYPLFHYMVLGAAYAPYIGVQFLIGNFAEPSSSFPYGLQDMQISPDVAGAASQPADGIGYCRTCVSNDAGIRIAQSGPLGSPGQ